ncbi:MAG: hypothetical protein ABWX83_16050 [Luteibacter sp.]
MRMWHRGLWLAGLGFLALSAHADDKSATKTAELWMGHEASELLVTFPIDSTANFETRDDPDTGGSIYSFSFIIPEHIRSYQVSDGSGGPYGMTQYYHMESERVPEELRCNIVFYATAQGVINNYKYVGTACGATIGRYKPKH